VIRFAGAARELTPCNNFAESEGKVAHPRVCATSLRKLGFRPNLHTQLARGSPGGGVRVRGYSSRRDTLAQPCDAYPFGPTAPWHRGIPPGRVTV
jgi:hypothetical protein